MSGWRRRAALALLLCASAAHTAAQGNAARVLDDFSDAAAWTVATSDQITATLQRRDDADGAALCLAFDFHGVSGYAAMRRRLPIDFAGNYEFTWRVRGDAPSNALQFKLADATGDNVWWRNQPDFAFTHDWQAQRVRKRDIAFAWGPTSDKTLRHSDTLEFTLYAGKGGRGEVCFDRLALRELPPPPATPPAPTAQASSAARNAPAANAIDGDARSAWRSARGGEQTLTLDFGSEREFGGLVLHWAGRDFAARYDIDVADDAHTWRTLRRVTEGNGGDDALALPDSSARYLRIAMHAGATNTYALREIEIRELAFGASANAFFAALAAAAPRGHYPRGFYNEQTYWTVVGIDGGHDSGLLSEDGALEVARGGFSLEPFLVEHDARDSAGAPTLTTWADVTIAHSLADGYLPLPSVEWRKDGLTLTTSAFGAGRRGDSRIVASYRVENTSDRPRKLTLALALRPFQVNPSVQFLNTPGGVAPIRELARNGSAIEVDGKARVFTLAAPDAFVASPFDAGMVVDRLADPRVIDASRDDAPVHDDTGLASGALLYHIDLAAHAARTVGLVVPLDGPANAASIPGDNVEDRILRERNQVAAGWRTKLDAVRLRVPRSAQPLADTLRTALAHILISRDGPALRPGTRAYARSWIRDGAMMADALLRLGRADAAREYLDWYAPYQFKNGKVPCCVDARGADPVPENDSHGELIHLAQQVYRYTGDRTALAAAWPHVEAAIAYLDALRASERTPANRARENGAFYGLMPASISHEGYSAKPMHSYWDDFWALTGYKNAVDIAAALGEREAATRIAHVRDEFRGDLHASIRTAVANHRIDYLPGAAELGDFDATSTTIALTPAGEQAALPQDLLRNTFERYWKQFSERRDSATWKDYTPYEWRNVSAFVRLGWRERAQQVIDFFMHDRRPAAWNQWAEVVGRDARESRFIGDMPHGWVASDFIRATLDLFAYERDVDQAMVLAAGIPSSWLDDGGIAIDTLRTPYGLLSVSLRHDEGGERFRIGGADLRVPPGGFVLKSPDAKIGGAIKIIRGKARWHDGALQITEVPADIVLECAERFEEPLGHKDVPVDSANPAR